ncbi:hypothetical protein ARZXY2_2258 [Arthrobacter sp. ZXY-2]|nr:hypothetical protein ARZXY2_2258 [Arthrobacter sp. ZXY-2]
MVPEAKLPAPFFIRRLCRNSPAGTIREAQRVLSVLPES